MPNNLLRLRRQRKISRKHLPWYLRSLSSQDERKPDHTMSTASGFRPCTHITMTRIHNPDFPCFFCRRPGSMGWLYRCTQDIELLIEEDLEDGIPFGVDKLSSLLPNSNFPKKRSPAARASNELAWFEETSEADRESYSPDQISTIVNQRAHVLEVIRRTQVERNDHTYANLGLHSILFNGESSQISSSQVEKSWVPTRECQFKCCHTCRPSLFERSFLSIDAVVNGEPPATAVTGFGFEYSRGRPVSLVKHVRNIGLRPEPTRQSGITTSQGSASISRIEPSLSGQTPSITGVTAAVPSDDKASAGNNLGQSSNTCDSTAMIRGLNIESTEPTIGDGSAYGPTAHAAFRTMKTVRPGSLKVAASNLHQIPAIVVNNPRRGWTGEDTDPSAARSGPEGRTLKSRRSATNLRCRFNVDKFQGYDDIGLIESLFPDNAPDGTEPHPNPEAVSFDEETARLV